MKKLIQVTSLMVAAAGLVLAPVASAHGKYDTHPKQERMHTKAKPHKMKKPAPKAKHHAPKPKHHREHRHEPH
ncbi:MULTISPECIES: hypothetical protein [unclassified Neisseria]|uniref:hypothetical protein n=1 Tax=unclassified Neisseria TaxID=2623750 RepID=UPI0008A86F15|nr:MULTISPECIES: hypothetical protein [unclassified Neisseria]OHP61231.1 hypothetical protein HMPREF2675_01195 [Neisseria sp. HMSC061H08]OHQ14779.1 hypothetical protein HMPREF2557_06020 [Neisseria sp. HMSC064F03]